MWLLLNSAGPVQRHLGPHRREPAAEGRAPEAVVRRLEGLAGAGVPPHHHVGVGAQARHVVGAAHDDVVGRELLEQLHDLGRLGRAIARGLTVAQEVLRGGTPTTSCSGRCRSARGCGRRCSGQRSGSDMPSFCREQRSRRPAGRPDHGRDADTVVRRPAHRQPGYAVDRGADARDPVEVSDGVLRQRAAPPLHVRVDGRDRLARGQRRGRRRRVPRAPRRSPGATPPRGAGPARRAGCAGRWPPRPRPTSRRSTSRP